MAHDTCIVFPLVDMVGQTDASAKDVAKLNPTVHVHFPNDWSVSFFPSVMGPTTTVEVWDWVTKESGSETLPRVIDIENLGDALTKIAKRPYAGA